MALLPYEIDPSEPDLVGKGFYYRYGVPNTKILSWRELAKVIDHRDFYDTLRQ